MKWSSELLKVSTELGEFEHTISGMDKNFRYILFIFRNKILAINHKMLYNNHHPLQNVATSQCFLFYEVIM